MNQPSRYLSWSTATAPDVSCETCPVQISNHGRDAVPAAVPALDGGVDKWSVKGLVPANQLRESEVLQIGDRLPLPRMRESATAKLFLEI